MTNQPNNWYASLNHGGLLVSPTKLAEFFDDEPVALEDWLISRLRRDATPVLDGATNKVTELLTTVFKDILGFNYDDGGHWLKASYVPSDWARALLTGETVRPDWLWLGRHKSALPIFIARKGNLGITADDWTDKRLGVGRSKRAVSRVLEWMRRSDTKLAVLTNGRQLRLIHAGLDYDAWAQWDVDLFFEEGRPSDQVTALRKLLGRAAIERPAPDTPCRLLQAIQASRQGQAELSGVLGERLRRAVELLIRSSNKDALDALVDDAGASSRDIYIAACRIVMRCVVILFAEARDLLPRNHAIYNRSYSLQGLREQLEIDAGGRADRLRHRYSAWPRLLALFRLVYDGSGHEELPVPAYGGDLFRPGDAAGDDPISRVLAAFEDPANELTDALVHRMLQFLTRSKVKVRVGKRNTMIDAPVDFSSLSTEYIGIIYEGLLDFELHRADEPMIFLNIGDEPVLPFDRLDGMTNKDLAELFSELAKGSKAKLGDDPDEVGESLPEEEPPEEEEQPEEEQTDNEEEVDDQSNDDDDEDEEDEADALAREYRERVHEWAKRAVVAAGIVKPPKDATEPEEWTHAFVQKVERAARALVPATRLFMPGRWYLVRWGGTRKGSGTFYTRPQLAVPTVHRTLEPLVYNRIELDDQVHLVPKTPNEILALKVCDPAMGSGSFPVAVLRYLTDALYQSLLKHCSLDEKNERTIIRLADGKALADTAEDPIPLPPDHPDFEDRLRARLKRYVVERCIYGVDLDPLAVELARMALWIETMDRNLPFGFVDHKIKCGNSLVGCWFDQFRHYPALAFERGSGWDGGDQNHKGVHFKKDRIGKALKATRNDVIKPELREVIEARRSDTFKGFLGHDIAPAQVFDDAWKALETLHEMPVHETRARADFYRSEVEQNLAFCELRRAFDIWCAIWFWPFDRLDHIPSPKSWTDPTDETRAIVDALTRTHRFFHWELEFPDAFNTRRHGFDAVLGNPPWEISKANSKEYFSNVDPLYRSYGKQEALDHQKRYFKKNETIEREWLDYNAGYKALSNFFKNCAHPFGDGKEQLGGKGESLNLMKFGGQWRDSDTLHRLWQTQRKGEQGFADGEHPFAHQGSADVNTYKLFLEMAHALLRDDGRMGFIVPSGIYTDKGSTDLRELFLEHCRWHWLFGFENRHKIFDIDSRFKFCPIIIQKGGRTDAIRAAFMHRDLADWEDAEEHVLDYPAERILQFSPRSKSILELRSERDLEILEKIYDHGVLLGDDSPDGWGIKYAREFDMTNDSHLFPPRPEWEARGYRPDEYGHWLKGPWRPLAHFGFDASNHRLDPQHQHWSILDRPTDVVLSRDGQMAMDVRELEDVALPLYEGRMINQFDFSEKGWVSGKGRSAEWREIPWSNKVLNPQYLMGLDTFAFSNAFRKTKVGFLGIGSATNSRSMFSSLIEDLPCGNAVPVIQSSTLPGHEAIISASLNSLTYDFELRCRLGGINVNYFVVEETALADPSNFPLSIVEQLVNQLNLTSEFFAQSWTKLLTNKSLLVSNWKQLWAITPTERKRIAAQIEAVIATYSGFTIEEFGFVVSDCDHPWEQLSNNQFARNLPPKGFWRVDKNKDPELRHTVLAQVAFQDLTKLVEYYGGERDRAIAVFCGMATNDQVGDKEALQQNNPHVDPTDGWLIPQTLRLADYALGHDDRAQHHQPVAPRLGPRFYDWQLAQSPEESWEECRRHAELLEMIVPTEGGGEDGDDDAPPEKAQGELAWSD